ncbi:MAG: Zn-ribbon domain-containing OB-fold protein [Betaproteobacteria bacterium]|nr:Zn-ribbon domain-containing OB-fold protein [Betaproteobacteria bacterium]
MSNDTGKQAVRRPIHAPAVYPETKAFWDAAAQGRLLLKHCLACGEAHYFPRSLCPFCFSDRTEWKEASGKGTIYTYSVTRRAGPAVYVIAYVTLDEGPTMMTNIVDCDPDTVRIGQRVAVVFSESDGGPPVPMFRPASVEGQTGFDGLSPNSVV